ncbi:MAG: hypothetical protein ACU85E_08190 [Gammaproteobacteria bacterium]
MKYLSFSLLLLLPLGAYAQMPPAMNQEQMQQMMQQMHRMQDCMQNIDQSEMKAFEQRARRMETEVQTLCSQGKRDEALAVAMKFGMEVSKSPSMQKMKKCGEHMKGFVPKMPLPTQDHSADGQDNRHVCDGMN